MIRLTLRTLLAYIDDTLEPDEARVLGKKVAESEEAQKVIERIKHVTRRRGLGAPVAAGNDDEGANPNVVSEYLSDNLSPEQVGELEERCLDSDLHLAEVAACHQILTVILTDPVRVPPTANQRMYKLVAAPASDPNRKPGKTTPVGGVVPTAADLPDADDPDAALLLGMKRFSESESWAGRIGLVTAVGVVFTTLALAVYFSLPTNQPQSPETSAVALAPVSPLPTPVTTPKVVTPEKAPEPKKVETPEPKKVEAPEPKKVVTPEPKKVEMPDPKVGGPTPEDLAPLPGNGEVGKIESTNVIVLTRSAEATAKWGRVDPAGRNTVRANDHVVALPGFKADVKLLSGLVVHLWGNVPEQVLAKPPLMEARVRFHPAAGGFDADLSLDAGRIYLTAGKPAGAKVRLHIGAEVWDIQLRDEKSEVMVQLSTAFVPGTPYAKTGGEKAKAEARLVVLRGIIDFQAPLRFKKFDGMNAWTEVAWDSKTAQLSDPHPAPKEDLQASKIPSIEAEFGKAVQKTLSDAQKNLTNPEGIRVLLKERLVMDPTDRLRPGMSAAEIVMILFPTQWAAYAQAAIMDGAEAGELLKDVLDLLRNESRGYVRQAAIVALSNWIARSPDNTEILVKGMVEKGWLPEVADLFAQLMRGYASPDMKDKTAAVAGLDRLVELLDDQHLAVREAALGNLLAFYAGAETASNRILTSTDMASRESNRAGADPARLKAWEAFLRAWKDNADAIKKRMSEKK
ncbi:MAG: hypothetical protein C0467_26845 [Planctomycetaceae bacterium]|nr:hypothetical protein [Planctomycetaceae bacterium]